LPAELHYTGPFVDSQQRPKVDFPWDRLNGKPLVYASLGTLQNESEAIFRTIAEAFAGLDVQLVISLGGGLDLSRLGRWPAIRLGEACAAIGDCEACCDCDYSCRAQYRARVAGRGCARWWRFRWETINLVWPRALLRSAQV